MMGGSSAQQQHSYHQQQHTSQQQYHGNNRHSTSSSQPTPLFERLVTEEVQELKTYQRIVENQSRRLQDLERIHGDLELRLEVESRGKAQLEATLEQREREWAMKFRGLQEDRDELKIEVEKEKEKNAKLWDQINRKDQDIHRMLQRKVGVAKISLKDFDASGSFDPSHYVYFLFLLFHAISTIIKEILLPGKQSGQAVYTTVSPPAKGRGHPRENRRTGLQLNSSTKVHMRFWQPAVQWRL